MWEAVASTNMHDLKAANCVLQAGMDIVMNDQRKELLVPYADTAHRLEEWTEAARRWELVRETNYNEPMGYWKGSEALRKVGNLAAAARVLASGTVMFPNDEHIATEARAIEQDA